MVLSPDVGLPLSLRAYVRRHVRYPPAPRPRPCAGLLDPPCRTSSRTHEARPGREQQHHRDDPRDHVPVPRARAARHPAVAASLDPSV